MVVACPECGVTVNGGGIIHTDKPSPPEGYTEYKSAESVTIWKSVAEGNGKCDTTYIFRRIKHTCANGHGFWTTNTKEHRG